MSWLKQGQMARYVALRPIERCISQKLPLGGGNAHVTQALLMHIHNSSGIIDPDLEPLQVELYVHAAQCVLVVVIVARLCVQV